MSYEFKGKVVFITGASSGIGAAVAKEIAKKGAFLVLAARRIDLLTQLKNELSAINEHVLVLECDVTKPESLKGAVDQALNHFKRIDIVVANAGFGVADRLDRLTVDDFRRQFETNVFGMLNTIYATLAELKKAQGRLVLVGSVSSHIAVPETSAYSMSKYAVRALAESIRPELARDGVTVTLISPGFVESQIRQVDNNGKLHKEAQDPVPAWLRMPTAKAAKQIVCAIQHGRREAVITIHGKIAVFLNRHFSWFVAWVVARGRKARALEP